MKRILLFLLLAVFCACPARGQRIIIIIGGTVTANVTDNPDFLVNLNQNVTGVTLTSTVTPATGYIVSMKFVQDATGSRTVTFGGNITTSCSVNGTAGTVTICRWQYTASSNAWADAGGGGGISNQSSAGMLDPTQAPYNVKADAYIFADGTSTNGSANFSSTSVNCQTSDTTKLMIVVNPVTGAYPFGTTRITVTGCSGNSWILSGTAGAAAGVNQNWAMGTDATPGGNTGLDFAFQTGITAPGTKGIALPCGNIIITAPPFQYPAVNNAFNSLKDIAGCGATGSGTTFILHPLITSALLVNGGNIFYSYSPSSNTTGSLSYLGLGGSAKISSLILTSIGGNIPGTAAKPFSIIQQFGTVENIGMWGVSLTAGNVTAVSHAQGEAKNDHLNLQQFGLGTGSSANYTGVLLQGQGINGISNSVIQGGTMRPAVSCNGAYCNINGLYCSNCGSGVISSGTSSIIVVGSTIGIISSSNGAAIGDSGNTTWYVFGNPLLSASIANFAPIQLGANSILDISGTSLFSTTSGYNISGPSTSLLNERRGNTFTSPLTQFTGTLGVLEQGICSNVTPVTVSANVTTDQNLMSCTVPANFFYTPNVTLGIWLAGVYSTPAASTTQVVIKAKLGSLTLATWTSTALAGIQATNDQFNVEAQFTVQTAGASSAFEGHGNLIIDLGVGNTVADSVFADVNTATVSPVDLTAAQTLQITIAFTVASASNSATQRQLKAQIW